MRALSDSSVKRLNRTVIYLPGTDRTTLAVFAHHGSLACVSALHKYGVEIWGNSTNKTHISVKQGTHRTYMPGIHLHQDDYAQSTRIVSPVKAAIQAMRCLNSHLERVIVLDSIQQKGLCDHEELAIAIRKTHQGRYSQVFHDSNGKARSGLETLGRLELKPLGLDMVCGERIPGVGEVDFLIEGHLIVELDGYEWHSGRTEFAKDRRRSREALKLGYPTLRFTYEEVTTPGFLAAEVLAYLDNRAAA